jgi:hypothetical protein
VPRKEEEVECEGGGGRCRNGFKLCQWLYCWQWQKLAGRSPKSKTKVENESKRVAAPLIREPRLMLNMLNMLNT